ncbi:MAG TPA: glycosyltransferase family 4 protein [Armatimonadota bacterium]|jgi:glycosyltransferase involved in cell wall biosynthesis
MVFLSSFVPRQCGLATFTEDLMHAVAEQGASCSVIAMNRPGEQFTYDARVVATVQEDRLDDYLAAAAVINRGRFDVLCVEHEYGIYGGVACDHLLRLLDAVHIPVVTTLHTLLRRPSAEMRQQLCAVAARSSKLMVMNGLAIDILVDVYGIERRKVSLVHHGAPTLTAPTATATLKRQLGCVSQRIISTFGLLGPGKGLEYAVQAMPAVVQRHPDAYYYILGKTHPVVREQHGERYREELQALARDLGMAEHVVFVDKYFSKDELLRYLQVSDIYLTPYLDMEQVTSGTLAYAMACGRPIISTPYLHARFLLDGGRGILVPPRQPSALAEACEQLLGDPIYTAHMERANQQYGQQLLWPQVGQTFIDLCRHAQPSRRVARPRALSFDRR